MGSNKFLKLVPCNHNNLILSQQHFIQGKPLGSQLIIFDSNMRTPKEINYDRNYTVASAHIVDKISISFINGFYKIHGLENQQSQFEFSEKSNIKVQLIKTKSISKTHSLSILYSLASDGAQSLALLNSHLQIEKFRLPLRNYTHAFDIIELRTDRSRHYLKKTLFMDTAQRKKEKERSDWAIVTLKKILYINIVKNNSVIQFNELDKPLSFYGEHIADMKLLAINDDDDDILIINLRSIDQTLKDANRLIVYNRKSDKELAMYVIDCINIYELPELDRIKEVTTSNQEGKRNKLGQKKKYYLLNEIGSATPSKIFERKGDQFDPSNKYPFFIKQSRNVTQSLLIVTCNNYQVEQNNEFIYFKFKTIKLNELNNVWNLTDFQAVFTSYKTVNITQGYQVYGPDQSKTDQMHLASMEIPLKILVPKDELEDE
ncbi:hypothetical protein FGO68_gene3992 [Halteria grandinella]|uniref:Uncharacterized protein n=1 Tax=Halteria grandinella TaxID=5974 RepID=A0A8J8NEV7_HALGN|nr:hypothetical protein FGO68_gene3992 [Halteria grandinella]